MRWIGRQYSCPVSSTGTVNVLDQIRTVDKNRLTKRLGAIDKKPVLREMFVD